MNFEQAIQEFADHVQVVAPGFVLVFCRVTAIMIFAPFFGSAKIPKRAKVLLALTLSFGVASGVAMPTHLPQTLWEMTLGIGGEICFGLAMGTILSLVFIAAQWGGEIIGQQMGLNISEVLDPQFGQAGSLVGDLYFWLTLTIFLAVGGHRAMLIGIHESFTTLPLLSVGIDRPIFDLFVRLFSGTATLAIQLAGPILVTMLVVDLALGCISKTMPQMNVMTAGLTVRAMVGMLVVIVGLIMTSQVLQSSVLDLMETVHQQYAMLRGS